jgi:hypothetical protein
MLVRPLAVAGALVVLGALTATALGSRPTGSAAATQRCFNFTVVQPDPAAGFAAGVYQRQNFSPNNSLSCNTTFDVFRSYLYDPQTHRGWTVGRLVGPLRNATGKRFVRNGTNGMTGFNIYRNARPPTPTTVTRAQNLQAGTTQTYRTSIPTRTPEVSQTTTLVNAPEAQILSSGFNVAGANTVYFATVRSPSLPGFQGRVQFQFRVQNAQG